MAENSEDFEVKLSDQDSPRDLLVEHANTELLVDDQIGEDSSDWLAESDLDDMFPESEEWDSELDEEPLDLGMDDIGNLVEDLKMDIQEEETDESVKGEKDMVFEEEETEEESNDSVESLLEELDSDDSEEFSGESTEKTELPEESEVEEPDVVDDVDNSGESIEATIELSEASKEREPNVVDDAENPGESAAELPEASEDGDPNVIDDAENSGESKAVAEAELPGTSEEGEADVVDVTENSEESTEEELEELDLSDEMDLSTDLHSEEMKDSSPETDLFEESGESSQTENVDSESSEVLEMLHDPEISEVSEAKDTEELSIGIGSIEEEIDTGKNDVNLENVKDDLVDIGESELDELKFDTETEENSVSETLTDSLGENEVKGGELDSSDSLEVEPRIEDTPIIEKVEIEMPIEIEASVTSSVPLDADMLLKFHHEAVVEIARTQLTGEEITQITYGSIIELDKVAGDPVNLVLDGKTIAHGEVVQINNDKLGIRIVGIIQE